MWRLTIALSVFFTTTYGANNHYLQKRLTGAGSTIGPTEQEDGFGGRVSGAQNLKLFTSPPLTESPGYYRDMDAGNLPNDDKGGKISTSSYGSGNHDHDHQKNHEHNHNHNHHRNILPESSIQQIGTPKNLNYPKVVTTRNNFNKSKDTTERYNRDIAPVSGSKNRLVGVRLNTTSSRRVKDNDADRMIYPTETDIYTVFGNSRQPQTPFIKPLNTRSAPRNCSFGICEEVEDYPTEKILKMISRSRDLQEYFRIPDPATKPDFHNRFGDNEDTLCTTMVHTKFPKSALNVNKEEKFLVNVGDFKQGIELETCKQDGEPCEYAGVFPNNLSTYCKQKYTVRRLMAVGKDSDKAVFDHFPLPSCCVCIIKRN